MHNSLAKYQRTYSFCIKVFYFLTNLDENNKVIPSSELNSHQKKKFRSKEISIIYSEVISPSPIRDNSLDDVLWNKFLKWMDRVAKKKKKRKMLFSADKNTKQVRTKQQWMFVNRIPVNFL